MEDHWVQVARLDFKDSKHVKKTIMLPFPLSVTGYRINMSSDKPSEHSFTLTGAETVKTVATQETESALPKLGDKEFAITEQGDLLTVTAKDLRITVRDNREVTVTLSGLDLKEEYVINQASSTKNYLEYGWNVRMKDKKNTHEVGIYSWAYDPGKEETLPFSYFSPCFYVMSGERFDIAYMDDFTMSHTEDSITWKYKMTDEYVFDFRNATEFTVGVTDSPGGVHYQHVYTRK